MKSNQPQLLEAVEDCFAGHQGADVSLTRACRGHGRQESRHYAASSLLPPWIRRRWPSVRTALRVTRSRTSRGRTRTVSAYAVTSRSVRSLPELDRIADAWQGHWGIENRLHRVRDVTLHEDACKVHKGNGAQVLACLRNLLLGVLRCQGASSIPATLRDFQFGSRSWLGLLGQPP